MSKAILILDKMPESCMECDFSNAYGGCYFIGNVSEAYDYGLRYVECPFKPMPEKKEVLNIRDNDEDIYEVFANKINVGFNRCIDEILGGNDE